MHYSRGCNFPVYFLDIVFCLHHQLGSEHLHHHFTVVLGIPCYNLLFVLGLPSHLICTVVHESSSFRLCGIFLEPTLQHLPSTGECHDNE